MREKKEESEGKKVQRKEKRPGGREEGKSWMIDDATVRVFSLLA